MKDLDKEHSKSNGKKSASPFAPKLTKRALLIEEKIKNKSKKSSLFDTDGDLSRHNIIEGERRRRRTNTAPIEKPIIISKIKRKRNRSEEVEPVFVPKQQIVTTRPVIKNARKKLFPEPKTEVEKSRIEWIVEREQKLRSIYSDHQTAIRELYQLEMFQNMLDYHPQSTSFIHDIRYKKYAEQFNLWESAKKKLPSSSTNAKDSQYTLVELLESMLNETSCASNDDNNINHQSTSAPIIVSSSFINTGTGIRRFNQQYPSIKAYLASFVTNEDGTDDITPEARDQIIQAERLIRQRLDDLKKRGGFTTELQTIANRRPQQIHTKDTDLFHDVLLSHVQTSAKLLQSNAKYKRNAAKRCAKAVERYWDNIRTQDERIQKEETKRLMRLAKWTSQQVKRKWKLIEKVCEARNMEILKEEQAVEGRRHLEMILEHSEQMLGVRKEELRTSDKVDDLWGANDSLIDDGIDTDNNQSKHSDRHHTMERTYSNEQMDDRRSTDDYESVSSVSNIHDAHSPGAETVYSFATAEEDLPIEDDGDSEDDDLELNALNEEAELSVEELMRRYKYISTERENDADDEGNDSEEDGNEGIDATTEAVDGKSGTLSSNEKRVISNDEEEEGSAKRRKVVKDNDITKELDKSRIEYISDSDRTLTDYGSSPAESDAGNSVRHPRKNKRKNSLKSKDTSDGVGSELVIRSSPQPYAPNIKVYTKIPFLLRGTLRQYQHVGLDWLASLYNNGLNGILADEMGLGKTIQTIALLAYLACEKNVWGPHLIVVPTSVILNWEMEFKKWLPGFKIMTYYGNPKERKEKRSGWSKENAFHVCITSYQLVLHDQNVFRRKFWHYLILDEAHHIKNFRSQRWQVLLNFNSRRRLLLTGTPLQNSLIELWSLLYFLMPNGIAQDMPIGFANLKEFQEWFSHPVDRVIENQQGMDDESRAAIQKLHTVLRPYLLRRLKADVEKQMPKKHEHIVYCKLSKRQRFLYDDFMSRAKTKETLASGNFLNIINCLMQLRKVCNHPDLFEERPIMTSFAMQDTVQYSGELLETRIRHGLLGKNKSDTCLNEINYRFLNLLLLEHDHCLTRTVADENIRLKATDFLLDAIAKQRKSASHLESRGVASKDYNDLKRYAKYREMQMHLNSASKWESINYINNYRCARRPVYGIDLIRLLANITTPFKRKLFFRDPITYLDRCEAMNDAVLSYEEHIHQNSKMIDYFTVITPKVVIHPSEMRDLPNTVSDEWRLMLRNAFAEHDILHPIQSRLSIAFPDKRLLQYDCGKLQKLAILLRDLEAGGHRALIFTQMTRVLDVLETFLNMHGYRYLRLDGATKVEQRQVLTEHFNRDKRLFCFILSTRSGGLGINLTGADTVIFYDSDWNPSMDKQCQDRAHRIGQTRDVHIYRFVTEFTIEENIFKKANQKILLDNMVIQEGEFTDEYFNKNEWWKDLPEVVGASRTSTDSRAIDYEQALLDAEDEYDAAAAIAARKEMTMDDNDFDDSTPRHTQSNTPLTSRADTPVTMESGSKQASEDEAESIVRDVDEDMQINVGHVDQYMLQFCEREIFGKNLGFGGFT
ncbi:SNF2 family N-terminal domain-containing protein [Pilobolus umbonatus]|nr:SNF2 family N-terminal domain-containing protein [Pilobolus umbonatus]